MKILRLELKNFKPFRDLVLPDTGYLPNGLIIIKGANSTGKSSIVEAILWALWGSDAVKPLTNDELVRFNSVSTQVILIFEVAGTEYKIDRTYDPANKTEVVLYSKTNETWKRIADKSQSVGRKIQEILHLSLKQALNTLLVRQGEVALIAHATPSVLRDLLIKIYNIELMGEMKDHLQHLESDLTTRKGILDRDYEKPENIQKRIVERTERIQEYTDNLDIAKKELEKTKEAFDAVPDPSALEAIRELSSDVEKRAIELQRIEKNLESDLSNAGLLTADSKVVTKRISDLKKKVKEINDSKKKHKKIISEVDGDLGAIAGAKKDLEFKIITLEGSSDATECPTCSKPLTIEERDLVISEYNSSIKDGTSRVKSLKNNRSQSIDAVSEHDERLLELSKAVDSCERIQSKEKELDTVTKDVEKLKAKLLTTIENLGVSDIESLLEKHGVPTLVELERIVRELTNKMGKLETESDYLAREIKADEAHIKKLETDITRMAQVKKDIDNLVSLHEHTLYARRKLVSGFLADFVIQKRLIGIVRGATNQYVKSFTTGQYSGVDLVPTPGRGTGGAGLILKIQDVRDNATKKTSQLSFGDRTAISLGLRLGISRTMSAIRPLKDSPAISPRVRCVILDEPLGGLDKDRRTSVVRNLMNDQSFEQILLITHTDVQQWEGIPVIEVSKQGSSSTATLVIASDD